MSISGSNKYKSIYCVMLCVLLAAVLSLAGCGGSDTSGSGNSQGGISDSTQGGNSDEQLTGQEITAGQDTLPSAAEVIAGADTEADADTDPDAWAEGDEDLLTGQMAGAEDFPAGETADEGDTVLNGLAVDAEPETGQEVQEIIAKPARRKGTLPEVYDPNPAYDKYALVEYVIDDIGAEFTATVSADYDETEFEVHCTLERVEQIVILDEDYNVTYDRTGNMGDDAPLIVQEAVSVNDWRWIGE